MSNLESWIEDAKLAAAGDLAREAESRLSKALYGAFRKTEHWRIGEHASNKQWDEALGGLLLYQDEQAHEIEKATASASKVSTTANAANDMSLDFTLMLAMSAAF